MLAVAVAYGAAQLVAPVYDLTLTGIFSNDGLFFAGLVLAASALAMAWRARRPQLNLGPRLVPQSIPK